MHSLRSMPRLFSILPALVLLVFLFFFNDTATTEIYTLSLHDALPICLGELARGALDPELAGVAADRPVVVAPESPRSEEHTSELQSHSDLVCRLLLEKKKKKTKNDEYKITRMAQN